MHTVTVSSINVTTYLRLEMHDQIRSDPIFRVNIKYAWRYSSNLEGVIRLDFPVFRVTQQNFMMDWLSLLQTT